MYPNRPYMSWQVTTFVIIVCITIFLLSSCPAKAQTNPDGKNISVHFIPYLVSGTIDNENPFGGEANSLDIKSEFNFKFLVKVPFDGFTIAPFVENESFYLKTGDQKQTTTYWRYGIGISAYVE